ncbi:MAG: hypothetical protein M3162_03980 [Thermoproteota archaeon]|nr:hypothetical protein [Thermoproteota archaeon]
MKEEVDEYVLKNRPLERIFQNNIARVIDFFIINQNFNFTTAEISHLSEIPLRTVQRIIPQLVEKGIIKEEKTSKKNKTYELNKESELVEILNKYSIATINSFIEEAKVNEEKSKIIITANKTVDDYV